MKTDVYEFKKNEKNISTVIAAAGRIAKYNELTAKQELRLTLLSEELVEMLPKLLTYGKAEFWIENDGAQYKIHALVEADSLLSSMERDEILSVSKSGRNAAATGIMNKIRAAAEVMLANYALSAGTSGAVYTDNINYAYYNMGQFADPIGYTSEWSLALYRENAKTDKEAWDELEKSIIANLADDVIVGIIGGKVEIVAVKNF